MTSDDKTRAPQPAGATRQDEGGLPTDLGNQMSGRSTWTDESESGRSDTPIVTDSPRRPSDHEERGVPDLPGQADDGSSTGTTFGTTGQDDKGM